MLDEKALDTVIQSDRAYDVVVPYRISLLLWNQTGKFYENEVDGMVNAKQQKHKIQGLRVHELRPGYLGA